jgi:hypothetical protein
MKRKAQEAYVDLSRNFVHPSSSSTTPDTNNTTTAAQYHSIRETMHCCTPEHPRRSTLRSSVQTHHMLFEVSRQTFLNERPRGHLKPLIDRVFERQLAPCMMHTNSCLNTGQEQTVKSLMCVTCALLDDWTDWAQGHAISNKDAANMSPPLSR